MVHRLFEVTGRCVAWFGEKDAQQVFLVRRMIETEGLPVSLAVGPTVREPDGLALSSRNSRLTTEEREQAGCLFLALGEAAALARAGVDEAGVLVAAMAREVGATPLARLDYAAVVDDTTFERLDRVPAGTPSSGADRRRLPVGPPDRHPAPAPARISPESTDRVDVTAAVVGARPGGPRWTVVPARDRREGGS